MNISKHIASVKIENFANHKDTFVIFDKGVNVVTGTSDSGKTSLIRAIMFVLDNSYSGSFVNNTPGVKHAKVTIEFKDGRIISRIKGDKINRVEFKNPDEQEYTVYSNFNTKYPEAVKKFLGNLPTDEDNKALYYAHQSKKLFLIDQNEGTIPKTLSNLLNIDDLEEASRSLASDIRVLEQDFKNKSKAHEALESEIENKYKFLDENKAIRDTLKELIEHIESLTSDIDTLEDYLNDFEKFKVRNKNYKTEIADCEKIINELSETANALDSLEIQHKELSSYIKFFNSYNFKSKKIEKEISKAEMVCNEDSLEQLKNIEALKSDVDNLNNYRNKFSVFESSVNKKKTEIQNVVNTISELEEEYDQIKQILIENDMICGSCNRFGGDEI